MAAAPEPATTDERTPLRARVRIDFGAAARFGPGKADLLEAVARTGSISAAGRATGMSYRRAWMLLDAVNRTFEEPVVTASVGGAQGGGARLTPFGLALLEAFRAVEADCAAAAERRLGPFRDRLAPGYPEVAGDPDG